MKKVIFVLLIVIPLIILFACMLYNENPYPYRGEYKELYTAAVYSIPDADGYAYHGEGAYDSDIYIWEQDDYGRTLFSYCEDTSRRIFGLVLCQTYDEENVYFYPDVNYTVALIVPEDLYQGREDYLKIQTEDFYLKNKDELKEANDWNKPLDKSKCVSYPITDHKDFGKSARSLSKSQCDEILNEYSKTLNLTNPESGPHRYNRILQVDAEGRVLHEIRGVHRDFDNPDWKKTDEHTCYYICLWVITDKDGNYDKETGIMVMYSKANDPDPTVIYDANAILEFKNRNGWKYSYCEEN